MAIEKMKFCGTNLLAAVTPSVSSYHPNFPIDNIYDTDWSKRWHSRHGEGSTWGFFEVLAENRNLDFDEGASDFTAVLTLGLYTATTLAAEIATQMGAVGANTYTVAFMEVGSYEYKWKIARATGSAVLNLKCGTGSHVPDTSTYKIIGYKHNDAGTDNRTGALTYYGDYVAIHTEERVVWNMGAATDFYYFAFIGHNLTASATVKVEFSTNNFSSTSASLALTKCGDNIYALTWDTPKNYQYARLWIEDPTNAEGFVAGGYVAGGATFQPASSFKPEKDEDPIDPSIISPSMGGQESALLYDQYEEHAYLARVKGSSERTSYKAHIAEYGSSTPFFFTEDPGSLAATMRFVRGGWHWRCIRYDTDLWELTFSLRDAR